MKDNNQSNVFTPSLKKEEAGVRSSGSRSFGGDDIEQVILGGITFRGAGRGPKREDAGKVKTKAKKKSYITGAHGSASAKKKADIRRARANRHKGK